MLCYSCGRHLTNDDQAPNQAQWTLGEIRLPYCADSDECQRDVETTWGLLTGPWLCRHGVNLEEASCSQCRRRVAP